MSQPEGMVGLVGFLEGLGFMMRADGSDPNAIRDTEKIITMSLDYFSKFL